MGDRVWQVPQDQFVMAWNTSTTLDEAATRVRELAGGPAPRWALMARAGVLKKAGVELKNHVVVRERLVSKSTATTA